MISKAGGMRSGSTSSRKVVAESVCSRACSVAKMDSRIMSIFSLLLD